jgi:phosphatidate cytidylyltransferase
LYVGVAILAAFYLLCHHCHVALLNAAVLSISLLAQKELYAMHGESIPYANYLVTALSLGFAAHGHGHEHVHHLCRMVYALVVPHANLASFGRQLFILFYTVEMAVYIVRFCTERQSEVFGLVVTISAFDTGSYLVGKACGRHPFSRVTPSKTIEGVVGGAILALLTCKTLMRRPDSHGVVLVATALLGDRFESFIKRSVGCKDSGTVLGAHGGVMDRVDSYVFTIPTIYLLDRWWQPPSSSTGGA